MSTQEQRDQFAEDYRRIATRRTPEEIHAMKPGERHTHYVDTVCDIVEAARDLVTYNLPPSDVVRQAVAPCIVSRGRKVGQWKRSLPKWDMKNRYARVLWRHIEFHRTGSLYGVFGAMTEPDVTPGMLDKLESLGVLLNHIIFRGTAVDRWSTALGK